MGWVEALTGLGLIVGPIIGSTLYSLLGYAHTFYIYGSFLIFLSFIIKLNFPGDNEDDSDLVDDNFADSNARLYEDDLSSFKNELTPRKTGRTTYMAIKTISQKTRKCLLASCFAMLALRWLHCPVLYATSHTPSWSQYLQRDSSTLT